MERDNIYIVCSLVILMNKIIDVLNGDTTVWNKEITQELMDFLKLLAHTVENLESRIVELEKNQNDE